MNELEQQLGAFKIGVVSAVDVSAARVRVTFDDLDNLESADLPVLFAKTLQDHYYAMPDVGEHVACLMDANFETGVVIGAIYDELNAPPEASQDKDYVRWGNGTAVEHDRSNGKITIHTPGDIEITAAKHVAVTADTVTLKAQSVTIDAPQTTCTGQLTVQGRLSYQSGLSGRGGGAISGDLLVTGGDVKADSVSLINHVHGGVQGGGDETGVPMK